MTVSDNLIDVIQKAASLQKVELGDGRVVANQKLHPMPSRLSLSGANFKSLAAFAAYCKEIAPALIGISSNAYIQVCTPELVKLVDPEYLDECCPVQDVYAVANCGRYITYEDRGDNLSQDRMVVRLMTKFIETESRQSLIRMISSLTDSEVTLSEDDGISQSVTVKSGVARKSKTDVSPTWYLAPIRTFLEVEQPESLFLLRIKSYNSIALHEADCNLWVPDAINKVVSYLKDQEVPYPVYG